MTPPHLVTPHLMEERKELDLPPGSTVRVHQKIKEGDKERNQVFEGIILTRKHGTEPGATFTVRRVGSDGIAVEKIFPLYSPIISKIEVTRKVKARRSKLYFLREKTPRQVREKLRRSKEEESRKKEEKVTNGEGKETTQPPKGVAKRESTEEEVPSKTE